jgi:glycosyltransferase involved in cell wall biosynthesis
MKKIKVYLQYPWMFPDSPYYKYLIQNPPEGIEFLNAEKQKGVITSKRFFWFSNFFKKNIRKFVNIIYPTLTNSHKSPLGDYDLIHCAHCLSKNKDKPWVCDIEYTSQLWIAGKTPKNKNSVKKLLLRKNCKKILSWTKVMKKELLEKFPEIENKLEVVYPGTPILSRKKKKHRGINLLFSGRYFFEKGGYHALEIMNRITKKYGNARGTVISNNIPQKIIRKYRGNNKIKIMKLLPQKRLVEEYYSNTDIFVYPGYGDSWGFSIPETMGVGCLVVSADIKSRREIITHNKTGIVIPTKHPQDFLIKISRSINHPVSKDLLKKFEKSICSLIENRKRLKRLSLNAKKEIMYGKLSIQKQQKEFKRIYLEALT